MSNWLVKLFTCGKKKKNSSEKAPKRAVKYLDSSTQTKNQGLDQSISLGFTQQSSYIEKIPCQSCPEEPFVSESTFRNFFMFGIDEKSEMNSTPNPFKVDENKIRVKPVTHRTKKIRYQ